MFWVYDSLGPFQKLNRYVKARKFYTTLKSKLDEAQQRWLDSQPTSAFDSEYIEHEPDGSMAQRLLGGVLQVRHKFFRRDDNRKV
tara:strand:+ start:64 stop:318 length:255 start_codon:yes stop_codon:yes gene_type:complete